MFQLDTKVFVSVESSSLSNQGLSEVGIDSPIAYLVGLSQGIARNDASKALMIEFLLVAPEASLNVSEAFPIGELGKTHTKELIPAGKRFDLVVALVALDTFLKFVWRKKFH